MKPQVVSFFCVLKNGFGRVLSSTFNNDVVTCPSKDGDSLLVNLAKGLQNIVKGERREIRLSADRAYGYYDPKKVIEVDREDFDHDNRLKKGDEVQYVDDDGENVQLRVTAIRGGRLVLDGNHPLAGQDLIFEIEVSDARDCTDEEIAEINNDSNEVQAAGNFH